MVDTSQAQTPRASSSPAAEGKENFAQASHEAKFFMSTLHQIEENGNVELMAQLFDEGAELWRPTFEEPYRALSGARRFWKEYLDQFEAIHSRFTDITERNGLLILEWEGQGRVKGGRPIHYKGVSIIELNSEKKVARFKTYFDAAPFLVMQTPTHPIH